MKSSDILCTDFDVGRCAGRILMTSEGALIAIIAVALFISLFVVIFDAVKLQQGATAAAVIDDEDSSEE